MIKAASRLKAGLPRESGAGFQTSIFRKKNKKRLLPGTFYLEWQLELICAFSAIIILLVLPDWLNDKVNLFLSGYDTFMDTGWITVTCNILLAGFSMYVIIRLFWVYFIRNVDEITTGKIYFAKKTDQLAELIFSLCIIILLMLLLISLVQFLALFLKNNVFDKMKNVTGTNQ